MEAISGRVGQSCGVSDRSTTVDRSEIPDLRFRTDRHRFPHELKVETLREASKIETASIERIAESVAAPTSVASCASTTRFGDA